MSFLLMLTQPKLVGPCILRTIDVILRVFRLGQGFKILNILKRLADRGLKNLFVCKEYMYKMNMRTVYNSSYQ
jgi:hypothetical protein